MSRNFCLKMSEEDDMDELRALLSGIGRLSGAEKLIVYGMKREGAGDRVRDVDVCVVADCEDKRSLERRIYLELESEISFDVIIYTPEEWAALTADPQSYASRILAKGKVYGEA